MLYRQRGGGVERLKNFHVLKEVFLLNFIDEGIARRTVCVARQPARRVEINTPFHYLKKRAGYREEGEKIGEKTEKEKEKVK